MCLHVIFGLLYPASWPGPMYESSERSGSVFHFPRRHDGLECEFCRVGGQARNVLLALERAALLIEKATWR